MEEIFISFLISVVSGMVCHYLLKWLGEDDSDN